MVKKEWERNCPRCDNKIIYYSRQNLWRANKNRGVCSKCNLSGNNFAKGLNHTQETKEKIRKSLVGRKHTEDTKIKISNAHKGKSFNLFTEETREKMRLSRWKQIEKMGGGPSFNPKACEYIDKLNIKNNWNLQHALNGGEIKISGYFVDGYDKERNIIFEYDEPGHRCPSKKKKDDVRQKRIISKINPSLFLRYDEKHGKLYEIKII